MKDGDYNVVVWPWPAKNVPQGRSIAPPRAGVGRRMERNRQKRVGQDKGSLTEQQTKGTGTTVILIKRIYKTNSKMHRATLTTQCLVHSQVATPFSPPTQLTPRTGTQHGSTWYRIPCSVWPVWVSPQGCVPSWLLVKINPALAKPRTYNKI